MNLDRELRPETIDEVVGHKDIKRDLKAYLRTNEPPHCMFIGPPGIGKNCLAYAFATEYFGRKISIDTEDGDPDYKELNASKDRGIEVVREVIIPYMQTKSMEYPKKRILFLDEFDSMTYPAQLALKAAMEKYEHNCLVIMSLNNESGVKVQALHSRSAHYYFKAPPKSEIAKWFVQKSEQFDVFYESKEIVKEIVEYYKGDLRNMLIDCLEAVRGYEVDVITKDDLPKIFDRQNLESLAKRVYESDNPKETFFKEWRSNAIDVRRFLENYYDLVQNNSKVFAIVDTRIRNGGSEMIQMSYLFDAVTMNQ